MKLEIKFRGNKSGKIRKVTKEWSYSYSIHVAIADYSKELIETINNALAELEEEHKESLTILGVTDKD